MPEKVSEYKSWCDPVMRSGERGFLRLAPGDIREAIKDYQESQSHLPDHIIICPKNEKFADEVPENVRVITATGVMLWEILLPLNGTTEPYHSPPRQQDSGQSPILEELPTREAVTHKILELASQNLSYRAIASNLLQYGVEISHMTVARRIRGERVTVT